ncbi:MAG: CocE/NonD family hydrolase [Deltaproteobacteria bacterium]|nr:CocE/NonD family hydrolase [Deltaproteobacteria bacterium]
MKKINKLLVFLLSFTAISVCSGNSYSQILETYMVEMRDGVKLATDVFLPSEFSGKLPAILVRTPYNKTDMKDLGNYISQTYTIAVVIQGMRGRYSSEGKFCFFRCDGAGELQDGVDTLSWIRNQNWSDGKVATYGGSALGITQYMLASTGIDLSAMVVEVASPDLYSDIVFQGGCFRKSDVEGWLNGIKEIWVLDEVKSHILFDAYWDVVDVKDMFYKFNVPAIHRGGWYDIFLQGTIDAYTGIQKFGGPNARGKQKLIIGPWVHSGVPLENTKIGDLVFPSNAKDIPQEWISLALIWLNHYLGTQPDPDYINSLPNVIYYTMGDVKDKTAPGNIWRTADDWPIKSAAIRYYPDSNGILSENCPLSEDSFSDYTYNPANPVPTVGGNNLNIAAGPKEQGSIESRADVLVFTTDVLQKPMEITGRVKAHLFVSIDRKDTDIMVRLSDVYPDGKSYLIMDGAQRIAARNSREELNFVNPGEIVEVVVDLWSTSIILNKGHKLRMTVSSSNYPRFEKNYNDGSSYGQVGAQLPVNVKLYHNQKYRSYIELPDPNREDSEINYCIKSEDAGYEIVNLNDGGTDSGIGEDIITETDTGVATDIAVSDIRNDIVNDISLFSDTDNQDTGLVHGPEKEILYEENSSSSGCSCSIN